MAATQNPDGKPVFSEIGDDKGEGGESDIKTEHRDEQDALDEEFTGMAQTGEQTFARDGQGAADDE